MKNILLVTTVFVGTAVIGGLGYKALVGCPQFAEVACVEQSKKMLSGESFKAEITKVVATPQEVNLTVASNFKCPVAVRLSLEAKNKLESLADGVRPAYTTPVLALLENGEGVATMKIDDYPELSVLPQGDYNVKIDYSETRTGPIKVAYYNERLGLEGGLKIKGQGTVSLLEGFAAPEQYASYMENWQKAYELAKSEGVTPKNIQRFEKLIGGYKKQEEGAQIRYTFPETLHAIFVNAETGAFMRAFRYDHGWEGL